MSCFSDGRSIKKDFIKMNGTRDWLGFLIYSTNTYPIPFFYLWPTRTCGFPSCHSCWPSLGSQGSLLSPVPRAYPFPFNIPLPHPLTYLLLTSPTPFFKQFSLHSLPTVWPLPRFLPTRPALPQPLPHPPITTIMVFLSGSYLIEAEVFCKCWLNTGGSWTGEAEPSHLNLKRRKGKHTRKWLWSMPHSQALCDSAYYRTIGKAAKY